MPSVRSFAPAFFALYQFWKLASAEVKRVVVVPVMSLGVLP